MQGTACGRASSCIRSNRGIAAQLVDDLDGKTSRRRRGSRSRSFKGNKSEQAAEVGKLLAKNAKQAGVDACVFDRAGYLYHGRVKSLADGAREGGLTF